MSDLELTQDRDIPLSVPRLTCHPLFLLFVKNQNQLS